MTKIESVKIVHMIDESPDTSFIGEYTDEMSDWAISREYDAYVIDLPGDTKFSERGREYRFFFLPYAGGEQPGTAEYRKYGMQDYERMEALNRGDWCFIGIQAEATVSRDIGQGHRRLQGFTSGGLWGIESDSGDDHLESVAHEELVDLKEHLEAFEVDTSDFDDFVEEAVVNPVNR